MNIIDSESNEQAEIIIKRLAKTQDDIELEQFQKTISEYMKSMEFYYLSIDEEIR